MADRTDFGRLLRESFSVTKRWADWFMAEVYDDADLVSESTPEGRTAAVALLSPVTMAFHGLELPSAYLSCCATARDERGRGYMTRLLACAVNRAAARGDAFVALIPATRRLYFLYDKAGFATVFYIDEQRYTSLHRFTMPDTYEPLEPSWKIFERLESLELNGVRHSRRAYDHAVRDLSFDGGIVVAAGERGGDGAAMAFVVVEGQTAVVRALLTTGDEATEAVLSLVRGEVGERSIVIEALPGDDSRRLEARGMIRIADAAGVLGALAVARPRLKMTVRLTDPLVEANNGVWRIAGGECKALEPDSKHRPDLDVTVDVLAKVLFSGEKIADIFGVPPTRPAIRLMLD